MQSDANVVVVLLNVSTSLGSSSYISVSVFPSELTEYSIIYYKELENHEIINIQLKKCENEIRKAMNTRIEKIIIIHGIGVGTLKKEVHQLLDQYNFRYYTSQDGGSTEVML